MILSLAAGLTIQICAMSDFFKICFIGLVFLFISPYSSAQKGPGGVSTEIDRTLETCGTAATSSCGVWLDASTLTSLADGDDLTNWPDVSISADCDNATVPSGALPPTFRDDPANTINGFPTITFDDGRFLVLQSSDDLNTESVTRGKTLMLAFRTSTEITAKQVIYEEGGRDRGFNILINNGDIIIGAYDYNYDADGTNPWGYTYIRTSIQQNTTYILTAQFSALLRGNDSGSGANRGVNTSPNYLRGWLNGVVFGNGVPGTNPAGTGMILADQTVEYQGGSPTPTQNFGVGTLFDHPDACGLGAVNSDHADRDGTVDNQSGIRPFTGKLAELCYYRQPINETQRIIVENYLAAKYLADVNEDRYAHQFLYGRDVVGLGRKSTLAADEHLLSQGRNPFTISVSSISSTANQYLFSGHNGASLLWSMAGVPNNSPNIRRLTRVWRVDRTNFTNSITIEVDIARMPPAPAGFSKLVLLVDETNALIPNFTLPTTKVLEIPTLSNQINYSIPDNAFYTFAWLRPEVSWTLEETFSIEQDPAPLFFISNLQVSLNYTPFPSPAGFSVDYAIGSGATATRGSDYDYGDGVQIGGVITIPAGQRTEDLPIQIINDDIAENPGTETFSVILNAGAGTTAGLQIGSRDTLDYTIYDDDPDPKFSFAAPGTSTAVEGSPHTVTILRTGNTAGAASCKVKVIAAGTTARNVASGLDPDDYNFTDEILVSFADGDALKTVSLDILADAVSEPNETIQLQLIDFTGVVAAGDFLNHIVTITDNTGLPQTRFATSNQSGFESVGQPVLFVTLDKLSSQPVQVNFSMQPGDVSPATYNSDYSGSISGTIIFPPFNLEKFLGPFTVSLDSEPLEPDENIAFKLTGATGASIAPSPQDSLTYTIIDYSPFEWRGAAGIGKASDNIIWVDADRMTGTGAQSELTNFSARAIRVRALTGSTNANLLATSINDRKSLSFDGLNNSNADSYRIDDDAKVNLAGFVEKLSYFFVARPLAIPNTTLSGATNNTEASTLHARLLYEQGGSGRGISIYLYDAHLYFNAWNNNDDGAESPWGMSTSSTAGATWARSSQTINADQNYIISCHYDNQSNEPLMVYVNGVKGMMSPTITAPNSVGRLYAHGGDAGLGACTNDALVHFTRNSLNERACGFDGLISEFIMFHEPDMNEARRTIIENYLSAKYNISLDDNNTRQIFDNAFSTGTDRFNNEVAGLGQSSANNFHGDAQGPTSVLRINAPVFPSASQPGYLMWGHNGLALTNTYPFSLPNAVLPEGVEERSGQTWRLFESPANSVNSADFLINYSASTNATAFNSDPSLLKLLVSTDPVDFSGAMVYDVFEVKSGNIVRFRNIPVSDAMYFSLGNRSPITISPLPITLLNFEAKFMGDFVSLRWSTASEINNETFIVERTNKDFLWKEVCRQDGAGNSNITLHYADRDLDPLAGISYYRLKQIDFDGQLSYSDVVSVINTSSNIRHEVALYPNPTATGSVFIRIPQAAAKSPTEISILDLAGKIVWKGQYASEQGTQEIRFGNINPGLYIVSINSDAIRETKKLVVE